MMLIVYEYKRMTKYFFRNQYRTHKDIPIPIKNSEKQRMKHGFGLKY